MIEKSMGKDYRAFFKGVIENASKGLLVESREGRPRLTTIVESFYPAFAEMVHEERVIFASDIGRMIHTFVQEYLNQITSQLVKLTESRGHQFNVKTASLEEATQIAFGSSSCYMFRTGRHSKVKLQPTSRLFYGTNEALVAYFNEYTLQESLVLVTCRFPSLNHGK